MKGHGRLRQNQHLRRHQLFLRVQPTVLRSLGPSTPNVISQHQLLGRMTTPTLCLTGHREAQPPCFVLHVPRGVGALLVTNHGSSTPGMATPGVGEYNVDKGAAAVSLHGESAIFKDETDRFLRHDGIYAQAVASTASSNPLPPSASPATLARALGLPGFATNANDLPLRDQTTAAFRGNDDRFEDRWSVYHANTSGMTPGVGTYTTDGTSSDLSFTKDSSFASSTDRFLLPHGVYTDQPGGESPAVGVYEASKAYEATQAARVRGAVKLQAAVRRRQSRGIFAQIEAEACQVPAPGHYAPELLPQLAKPKRPAPSEKQMADAAAKALLASTLDTLEEATAALESLAVVDEERSPATESSATAEAPAPLWRRSSRPQLRPHHRCLRGAADRCWARSPPRPYRCRVL